MKTRRLFVVVALLTLFSSCLLARAEGLSAFKLHNGATVYIWEDKSQPDVYGMVTFNVGAIDDPAEYTGLAHYLEHVMFKGTQTIGALDWEKEKPLYEQIIAKYDEFTYSLAKQLYEAVKIKNLDSITVELGDNSAIDIDMDNIKKIYNEMRSEYITISGIPDTYSNKNKSFKIKKYSCYIHDDNDEIIKVIKELIENKIYVEVSGKRKPNHDNTIYITNITNDDINLSFSI